MTKFDSPEPRDFNALFGQSLVAGDVDGDERAEILVGSIGFNNFQGRVYLYSGSGDLLTIFDNPTGDERFGSSIAIGDVSAEPGQEILIGSVYAEAVYIFSASGSLLRTIPRPDVGEFAAFGDEVISADVDGNGYEEVIVGAPTYDDGISDNIGRVYVHSGVSTALLSTIDFPGTSSFGESYSFGYALAGGDLDGDGKDELVVAHDGYPDGDHVQYGALAVYNADVGLLLAHLEPPLPEQGMRFGTFLAMGDVDGDGLTDVVTSSDGSIPDYSPVYAFSGTSLSLLTVIADPLAGSDSTFGLPIALGDLTGDGKADIVVGATNFDADVAADAGRVYAFTSDDDFIPDPVGGTSELRVSSATSPGSADLPAIAFLIVAGTILVALLVRQRRASLN